MGHKRGPVLLLLLFTTHSLSLNSCTRFEGMKATGYTAVGPCVKQGQGTRKKGGHNSHFLSHRSIPDWEQKRGKDCEMCKNA